MVFKIEWSGSVKGLGVSVGTAVILRARVDRF